jgi:sorbitol-6-phosphate 2-dehydrogenase
MRLSDKVAIVTGAGQGIGREICFLFADEGANLCACDSNRETLDDVATELKNRNGKAFCIETDISREDDVRAMFKETVRTFGQVDILVNNVGVLGPVSPINRISNTDWKNVVDTNLNGTYYCIKQALNMMIPRLSGNIINIGSVAAVINPRNRSVYSATKKAIVSITRTVAVEVGQYNIRCNCLSPGPIDGERLTSVMEKRAEEEGKTLDEIRQLWLDQIPLKRLITAKDIAKAAVFFANDESSAITGQHLCVSGGQEIT